jgi:glucokinase
MRTLAIDVGGTKFALAAFEGERMVLRESRATDRGGGPAWMFSQIEQIVHSWRSRHHFLSDRCGIGFGGPVDFPSQTVTLSTHVEGWAGYPLVESVRGLAGVPVVMDNDANAGALGEALYGAGKNADPLFYMTLSTGIGGGIVSGRELYRGANSYAGEIGHLNVEPDGPDCLCGSRGCYERMCCGLWLERDHGKPAQESFCRMPRLSAATWSIWRGA